MRRTGRSGVGAWQAGGYWATVTEWRVEHRARERTEERVEFAREGIGKCKSHRELCRASGLNLASHLHIADPEVAAWFSESLLVRYVGGGSEGLAGEER